MVYPRVLTQDFLGAKYRKLFWTNLSLNLPEGGKEAYNQIKIIQFSIIQCLILQCELNPQRTEKKFKSASKCMPVAMDVKNVYGRGNLK